MSICGYSDEVWICTGDSYKNIDNLSSGDSVAVFNSGDQIVEKVEEVIISNYTGDIINIWTSENKLLMSVTPSQRMFWFTKDKKPRVGPARDFLSQVDLAGSLDILTAFDENKMHRVYSDKVSLEHVTNKRVWGVRTNSGNVVVKAEAEALVFSDVG